MNKPRIAILGIGLPADATAAALGSRYRLTEQTDDPRRLVDAVRNKDAEAAALCAPDEPLASQLELADRLLVCGADVFILRPSVPHGIEGLGLVERIGDKKLVRLPARPIGHRVSPAKRLFDVAFALIVLLAGLPLWLLIAAIVFVQDRGPVFFVQDRVGRFGRPFRFLKFRTMWPDADRHRGWYEARYGRDGHLFKLADDPRRTPLGGLLRRFSLDEVPQFLHVLTARMSVVGPRPPLPSEVDEYRPWQQMRLAGWMGVTGLWQVCGRSEVRALDDIVLLDAIYLHNQSFQLDARIILRTIHVMVNGRGAY
jgi:lipopolysaccharide/colanic/teichoic acid biosynthesis glycosyltransferase